MKPLTGVISIHNVNYEFIDDEICIDCEAYYRDLQDRTDLSEEEKEDSFFNHECFDHKKLIGDWQWEASTEKYSPNLEGENGYSAIVTDSTFSCIQVVWSKYTKKVRAMCSPCFPGQADLDSGEGNIEAYCLPEDLLREE